MQKWRIFPPSLLRIICFLFLFGFRCPAPSGFCSEIACLPRNKLENDIGDRHKDDGENCYRDVPFYEFSQLGEERGELCGAPCQSFTEPETSIGEASHNSNDYHRSYNYIPYKFKHKKSSFYYIDIRFYILIISY